MSESSACESKSADDPNTDTNSDTDGATTTDHCTPTTPMSAFTSTPVNRKAANVVDFERIKERLDNRYDGVESETSVHIFTNKQWRTAEVLEFRSVYPEHYRVSAAVDVLQHKMLRLNFVLFPPPVPGAAVLCIHGYHVPFDKATRFAAYLGNVLGIEQVYSVNWMTGGGVHGYFAEPATVKRGR